MKSGSTPRFWKHFHQLPPSVQTLAKKNYRLWRQNPRHSSLRFRPVEGFPDLYTVRVGSDYRALGTLEDDIIIWFWIGSHAEYDRILR